MKSILRGLIGLGFLLLVCLALMPSILSSSFGTRVVCGLGGYFLNAELSIESLQLSWTGEQKISGLLWKDLRAKELFSVREITYKNALYQLLLQKNLYSQLELVAPQMHLYPGDQQTNQLKKQSPSRPALVPALVSVYPQVHVVDATVFIHQKNEQTLALQGIFINSSQQANAYAFDVKAEQGSLFLKALFRDFDHFELEAKLDRFPEKLIPKELLQQMPDLSKDSTAYFSLKEKDGLMSFDGNVDSPLIKGRVLGKKQGAVLNFNPQTELSLRINPLLWNEILGKDYPFALEDPLDLLLAVNEAKLFLDQWQNSSLSCKLSSQGAKLSLKGQPFDLRAFQTNISSSRLSKGFFNTLQADLLYEGRQSHVESEAFLKDLFISQRPSCRWTLKSQALSLAFFRPLISLPKSFEKEMDLEIKGMSNQDELQAKVQLQGKALGSMNIDLYFDYDEREFSLRSLHSDISKVLGPWAKDEQVLECKGSLDGIGLAGFHDLQLVTKGKNINAEALLTFEEETRVRASMPLELKYLPPKVLIDSIFSGKAPFKTDLGALHFQVNPFEWDFTQDVELQGALDLERLLFGKDNEELIVDDSKGTWIIKDSALALDFSAKTTHDQEIGSMTLQANLSFDEGLQSAFNWDSPSFKGSLNTLLKDQRLSLNKPVFLSCSLDHGIARKVLLMLHPLFQNLKGDAQKISLFVADEGFDLQLKPFNLQMKQASIQAGRLQLEKGHFLQAIFSLLRHSNAGSEIWMTPIYLSAKDGILHCHRMDALLDELYPLAIWGQVDLHKKDLDMSVAISSEALEKALKIKNLSEDEYLVLPLKGTLQKPKLKTKKALGQIASLLARQHSSHAALFLGSVIDRLREQESIPQQTTNPLPWKESVWREDLLKGKEEEKETPELFELLEQMP